MDSLSRVENQGGLRVLVEQSQFNWNEAENGIIWRLKLSESHCLQSCSTSNTMHSFAVSQGSTGKWKMHLKITFPRIPLLKISLDENISYFTMKKWVSPSKFRRKIFSSKENARKEFPGTSSNNLVGNFPLEGCFPCGVIFLRRLCSGIYSHKCPGVSRVVTDRGNDKKLWKSISTHLSFS